MWKCASEKKQPRDRIGVVEEFVNADFVADLSMEDFCGPDLSVEDPLRRKAPRLMDDTCLLDRIQYACHIDDEDTNTNANGRCTYKYEL